MTKILIIQIKQLGDVLLTTPIIDVLYKKFNGDVKIDFLVDKSYIEILEGNPYVNDIIVFDKSTIFKQIKTIFKIRKNKYDFVFDFLGNPRSAWITLFSCSKKRYGFDYRGRKLAYTNVVKRAVKPKYIVDFKMDLLKDFGIENGYRQPSIYLKDELLENMKSYFLQSGWDGISKIVCLVAPNVRPIAMIKNWIFNRYIELSNKLIDELGVFVWILWGPGEDTNAIEIRNGITNKNMCMMNRVLNLKELAALIKLSSVVLSSCTGPKHIGVAVGTPTVTIFGPTYPECLNPPDSSDNLVLQSSSLACIGCYKVNCDKVDDEYKKCMKDISVDMAFDALKKFL